MKKVIFISMLLIFATGNLFAQDFYYGLKAGPNFATVNTSESEMNDAIEMRTAFHFGAVGEYAFSDQFSIQAELLYNAVGYKYSDDYNMAQKQASIATVDQTFKIDYLSIPILAKYYVADGFSLQAGPQVGFLLAANVELELDGETETNDFKDNMESLDFGLGFGFGYKIETGLFADARYVLGLANLAKDEGEDFTVKNNVIQVSVGYMF